MTSRSALLGITLAMVVPPSTADAILMTTTGNEPLSAANYTDWPGIVDVVNQPSRVQHVWCNGYEINSFRGDSDALTAALLRFAMVKCDRLEVVLRPASGLPPPREPEADWTLELRGGIIRHFATTSEKGALIDPPFPVLTIYVGPRLPLDTVRIPKRLIVVGLPELKRRHVQALHSSDPSVRARACHALVQLDCFDENSLKTIVPLLADDDDRVRRAAAESLQKFGPRAAAFLPASSEPAPADRPHANQPARAPAEVIDEARAEQAHRDMLDAIDRYLEGRQTNGRAGGRTPAAP